MLNSEQGRAAMAAAVKGHPALGESTDLEPWEAAVERPNVFAMYEDNIGMMSPMIADELPRSGAAISSGVDRGCLPRGGREQQAELEVRLSDS